MSASKLIDEKALAAALQKFADERDWNQFHSPKNLTMALSAEVGELVELFQWLTEDQSRNVMEDAAQALRVREEIADVAIYLVRLASVLRLDLDAAVRAKLASNAKKYPARRKSAGPPTVT